MPCDLPISTIFDLVGVLRRLEKRLGEDGRDICLFQRRLTKTVSCGVAVVILIVDGKRMLQEQLIVSYAEETEELRSCSPLVNRAYCGLGLCIQIEEAPTFDQILHEKDIIIAYPRKNSIVRISKILICRVSMATASFTPVHKKSR